MIERMKYNPALLLGFILEDNGHEVDWEEIYKAADICSELVPNPYKSKKDKSDDQSP